MPDFFTGVGTYFLLLTCFFLLGVNLILARDISLSTKNEVKKKQSEPELNYTQASSFTSRGRVKKRIQPASVPSSSSNADSESTSTLQCLRNNTENLKPVNKTWTKTPARILDYCPILGFGDSVDALLEYLAHPSVYDAFEEYIAFQSINIRTVWASSNDAIQTAIGELDNASLKYRRPVDKTGWKNLDHKFLFFLTGIEYNQGEGRRWHGNGVSDYERMAHASVVILGFLVWARRKESERYTAVLKLRELRRNYRDPN